MSTLRSRLIAQGHADDDQALLQLLTPSLVKAWPNATLDSILATAAAAIAADTWDQT